jgi:hypothetical protein
MALQRTNERIKEKSQVGGFTSFLSLVTGFYTIMPSTGLCGERLEQLRYPFVFAA